MQPACTDAARLLSASQAPVASAHLGTWFAGGAEGGLAHYPSTVSSTCYDEEDEDFTCHICLVRAGHSAGCPKLLGSCASFLPSSLSAPRVVHGSADSLLCLHMQKVLYMPVGLSCGHKVSMHCLPGGVSLVALPNSAAHHSATPALQFCLPCVLLDAGVRDFRGNPRHLLHHKVKKDQPCPECLVKGVFQEAVDLERLGAFIKQQ